MNRILFLFLLVVCITSCYSYKIFPIEDRSFVYTGKRQLAFILNPELKNEKKILEQSGIFEFTDDSLNEQCLKIKLHAIKRGFSCGQPIVASFITLGQMPVYFPDRYQYKFEEINKSDSSLKYFELHTAQRFWFWDMFTFKKKFDEKAGKALLANYFKK